MSVEVGVDAVLTSPLLILWAWLALPALAVHMLLRDLRASPTRATFNEANVAKRAAQRWLHKTRQSAATLAASAAAEVAAAEGAAVLDEEEAEAEALEAAASPRSGGRSPLARSPSIRSLSRAASVTTHALSWRRTARERAAERVRWAQEEEGEAEEDAALAAALDPLVLLGSGGAPAVAAAAVRDFGDVQGDAIVEMDQGFHFDFDFSASDSAGARVAAMGGSYCVTHGGEDEGMLDACTGPAGVLGACVGWGPAATEDDGSLFRAADTGAKIVEL